MIATEKTEDIYILVRDFKNREFIVVNSKLAEHVTKERVFNEVQQLIDEEWKLLDHCGRITIGTDAHAFAPETKE